MAIIATPRSNNGNTGACPMINHPIPKNPIHKANINPQCFLRESAIIPPGRVTIPEAISLVVVIAPTPILLSPKACSTSGSNTKKLWVNQWKTP